MAQIALARPVTESRLASDRAAAALLHNPFGVSPCELARVTFLFLLPRTLSVTFADNQVEPLPLLARTSLDCTGQNNASFYSGCQPSPGSTAACVDR